MTKPKLPPEVTEPIAVVATARAPVVLDARIFRIFVGFVALVLGVLIWVAMQNNDQGHTVEGLQRDNKGLLFRLDDLTRSQTSFQRCAFALVLGPDIEDYDERIKLLNKCIETAEFPPPAPPATKPVEGKPDSLRTKGGTVVDDPRVIVLEDGSTILKPRASDGPKGPRGPVSAPEPKPAPTKEPKPPDKPKPRERVCLQDTDICVDELPEPVDDLACELEPLTDCRTAAQTVARGVIEV